WGERPRGLLELFIRQRHRDFTGPIGAVVVHDHAVVIAYQPNQLIATVDKRRRFDELIGDPSLIGLANRLRRALEPMAIAENHCSERTIDPLPTLIAIHCVIASRYRSDFADPELVQFFLDLLDVAGAALGSRIAAIHEAVDEYIRQAVPLCHIE